MTPEQRKILEPLAFSMLNICYGWGGSNPSQSLDCSGLTIELLVAVGVLPHGYDTTALGLWKKFPGSVDTKDVEFGDLVFFGPTVNTISHIGFCLSKTIMIEAGGGNSTVNTRLKAITMNARVRIRPIANRRDVLGFKRPEYVF